LSGYSVWLHGGQNSYIEGAKHGMANKVAGTCKYEATIGDISEKSSSRI